MNSITVLFLCEDLELDFEKSCQSLESIFDKESWSINLENTTPCDDMGDFDYGLEIQAYDFTEATGDEVQGSLTFVNNRNGSKIEFSETERVTFSVKSVEKILHHLLDWLQKTVLLRP